MSTIAWSISAGRLAGGTLPAGAITTASATVDARIDCASAYRLATAAIAAAVAPDAPATPGFFIGTNRA